jgi:hypothetical protein
MQLVSYVNLERIFSDYVDKREGDSLTTKFGEEVMENYFSGPGDRRRGDERSLGDHEEWEGMIKSLLAASWKEMR